MAAIAECSRGDRASASVVCLTPTLAARRAAGRRSRLPGRSRTSRSPRGYSRAQIAQLAREAGAARRLREGDDPLASTSTPPNTAARTRQNLEGFLFPDTFELDAHAPVDDLVQRQLAGLQAAHRGRRHVLREVEEPDRLRRADDRLDGRAGGAVGQERKLIAAVIYNRLHDGIPLGIDATIRFANDNYTEPLTESELAGDSPYNTRVNAGLPPGPIGNPGLASIEAAAHPAKVDYLYYVVKPGTCGEHSFSSTDAEFEADVARYNEAREAAGGNSPDSCGDGAMPRLAVLGHPVGHSRSPAMHAAALAELGLAGEWTYEAIDVAPDEFEALVRGDARARASPAPTSPSRTRARR